MDAFNLLSIHSPSLDDFWMVFGESYRVGLHNVLRMSVSPEPCEP